MAWDDMAVRIEFHDAMTIQWGVTETGGDASEMKCTQSADIYLLAENNKGHQAPTTRKPAARLVADTRAELLRNLADWVEQNDDPGLRKLADDFADKTVRR